MNNTPNAGSSFKRFGILLTLFIFAQPMSALPDGFSLSPLKLNFEAGEKSASLKIRNDAAAPVSLQLEAVTWAHGEDGEDRYSPTREIVIFPKIFTIEAHGEQIVRVGYQGAPAQTIEKPFRLFVQELPGDKTGVAGMEFTVRMSIPVFVRPEEDRHTWQLEAVGFIGHGLNVGVQNTGNHHLMVGAMQATGRDGNGHEVFRSERTGWYVLAGQERGFVLPVTSASCQKIVTMEVSVSVGQETRSHSLDEFDCDQLGRADSAEIRATPGN